MGENEDNNLSTFERADAGASNTFPQQAGTIRKGGFIVIKGRPCRVVEVSTSKTGKHGHAKCNFTAIDIFNGKKMEDMCPSSHNCEIPNTAKVEYQLLNIGDDDYVSLMDTNGNTKDDLALPKGTAELEKLSTDIKAAFDEGRDIMLTVLSAMGEEQIQSMKGASI